MNQGRQQDFSLRIVIASALRSAPCKEYEARYTKHAHLQYHLDSWELKGWRLDQRGAGLKDLRVLQGLQWQPACKSSHSLQRSPHSSLIFSCYSLLALSSCLYASLHVH